MPRRFIAHVDLDCFFVSVERINNPSLVGLPVAVGGSPEGRGVIASASYEARKFGVRSAMPTGRALRLCPGLLVLPGHHHQYSDISRRLSEWMSDITPVVEQASIDEMYLDFTGCESLYHNDIPGTLLRIQKRILDEFSLPCTISLASNKLVAKIATDTVKPQGHIYVEHGREEKFLAPLPVGSIPGIGRKTGEFLQARGIHRIGDLQKLSLGLIVRMLGAHGSWIYNASHGIGPDILESDRTAKSISREETFASDISDLHELERVCFSFVGSICSTLRSHGLMTRTVTLKLRTPDFITTTHRATVEPTSDDAVIFFAAKNLLHAVQRTRFPVRLLGVGLSNFINSVQEELFPETGKRARALEALDKLRARFGPGSIKTGSV